MAWEARGRNLYYYRKKRIGRTVVSEYVGRGLAAQKIALMESAERKKRYETIRAMRQQEEEFSSFNNRVTQGSLLVDQMVKGFLIIAGFHKHKGQWRRRRDVNKSRTE